MLQMCLLGNVNASQPHENGTSKMKLISVIIFTQILPTINSYALCDDNELKHNISFISIKF